MFSQHRNNPSAIRCALRALRDPGLADGSGPNSRRTFRRGQDGRAAQQLLDMLMVMRQN